MQRRVAEIPAGRVPSSESPPQDWKGEGKGSEEKGNASEERRKGGKEERESSVRYIKLTYVGFRAHVKIASRIVS